MALALSNLRLSPVSGAMSGVGTDLDGTPAPDFHLVDQTGQPVALSDLRGRVVVLTFLYTRCPDTCPLIVSKLGQVHDQLGEQAQGVAFVAVTVEQPVYGVVVAAGGGVGGWRPCALNRRM